MNLEEQIYYSCAAYSSIHPNRAAVLNHLFVTLGNGYEWENGELVECCGDTTTKSGRRLSVKAAINQVFRRRRKSAEFRKEWERKRQRDEKLGLKHKKDCPIITRCNCGMFKFDPKNHTAWCAKNFSPTDKDVLRCDCGASARIAEKEKLDKSIDEMIDRAVEAMKNAPKEDRTADRERLDVESKKLRKEMRESRKWEYRVPTDIKKRVKNTDFHHWYPVSMNYPSHLANFPEDIKDEWLDAIIETATLIANSYERFERGEVPAFTTYPKHNDPDGSGAKKMTRETYVVANFALHRANEMKEARKRV